MICIQDLATIDGKTKSVVNLLGNLAISGSALVVTRGPQEDVVRAAHNVKKAWTLPVDLLNAHELLRRETVIMTVDAIRRAEELWAVPFKRARGSSTRAAVEAASVDANGGGGSGKDAEPPTTNTAEAEAAQPRRRPAADDQGTE